MAAFSNQATLSYNGNTTNSNIVTGEIIEVLSASKTSVDASFEPGSTVTYIISIVNAGNVPYMNLVVTDNLGEYPFGAGTLVPFDYVEGSVKLYVNGVLQTSPTVSSVSPLTFTGIDVPAGGNALLIYDARANEFAPLAPGTSVTNTATVTCAGITNPITATETISANGAARLTITKSVSPETVSENGSLTYTFVIQNSGSSEAGVQDNVTVTDIFDPILDITSVTLGGVPLAEGADYTYDEASGTFRTVPGRITVPAATYTQNPVTGQWAVTPGVTVLTVSGNV